MLCSGLCSKMMGVKCSTAMELDKYRDPFLRQHVSIGNLANAVIHFISGKCISKALNILELMFS